jgi:hypothetical protein
MSDTVVMPDLEAVRALGAQLITPELIVLPVRHHSPACAWQVHRAFALHKPSVVLVEGPRSFNPLIPLLTHAEARAPLAVYTYAVKKSIGDEPEERRAAYYPFCDYSPELVALREAQKQGVPARFIDLDYAEQCQLENSDEENENVSLLDERHLQRSQYLQALAKELGCRNHEELWEHLFEVGACSVSLEEHVARVAAYCHLSRIESTEAELSADGTLQREAEMLWHIRQALAERTADAGPVLVVLGGFHAVVISALLKVPPARPKISRSTINEEASALIRYSFDRLDRLNGYASGMTSPAWHQYLWEQILKYEKIGDAGAPSVRRNAALNMLTDIALELRGKHGVPLPMPALAAAYEQTLRLAELRGRPTPVRDDVRDAVTSCFIKGDADSDGALVLAVADRIFGGTAMGHVPPGASVPPLVKDFSYRARRQKLKIDDSQPRRSVLDIYRRPVHRQTSRLLHELSFLAIPFAVRTAGPDFVAGLGLDRLQEHWEYLYSAATEAALVEASVYGATLPIAVANRFSERLNKLNSDGQSQNARASAALMTQAFVLGLHDHLPRVIALLRQAIAMDAGFDSVAAAVANLALLLESREPLEARDVDELPPLLQAAYERAIYLGRELRGTQTEHMAAMRALSQLRELLISEAGRSLDGNLYWAMVESLQQHHDAAIIRGACAGLRYSAGLLSDIGLGEMLSGHMNGLSQPIEAVAFLRGLLQTAREAAWQQAELLSVLDQLFLSWNDEDFVASLPELRLAFASMTPKETDRVAEAVAGLHGKENLGRLVSYALNETDLQRHLQLSTVLTSVLAADGLSDWVAS